MTKILIADAIKPSLVMSSEVFKDKIPGALVVVASTGAEALELVSLHKPDLCLVDFDLPDVDGPSLILALRRIYSGPILMTAYPDENVATSVLEDLYAYADASAWIKKPVRFDELSQQIDKFLIERRRTGKRFHTALETRLIAKAEGRGKRAPKVTGHLVNLSLGGACIQMSSDFKMKKKQELTLCFIVPSTASVGGGNKMAAKKPTIGRSQPSNTKANKPTGDETKIKATVAWITKEGKVGLQFGKLSDDQLRNLEVFLKGEAKNYQAA